MIFSKISAFAQKYRVYVILFWVAAAAALFLFAPSFSSVSVTDESQFLPNDTQSTEAKMLLNEKFVGTGSVASGSGTLIIYNSNGLSDGDMQDAKLIRDWLVSGSAPAGISGVTSVFDNDLLRQVLVSKDGTAMMMQVKFSVDPLSGASAKAVDGIRNYLVNNYSGQNIYFTGETGLLHDLFQTIQQTLGRTTIITVVLVLIILLIIYRSPLAALLPLFTIGCSYLVALGLLGFIGHAGLKFFSLAQAYLVVIIFGIGTDYCLFIVSRYREELKKTDPHSALNFSMRHIGPVIAASAATVIVAFLCLGLSRFGMNRTSGIALAVGIAVTLIAGLTLIPALISLFGKYLFWPTWASGSISGGKFSWAMVGNWIVKRPLIVALPIIALLVIPYVGFSHFAQSDDLITQMPSNMQSVQGYRVLEKHFNTGELTPMYLLIESPGKDMTGVSSLTSIGDVALALQKVKNVTNVDYFSAPAVQLTTMASQIRSASNGIASGGFSTNISSVLSSNRSLQSLTLQYPGIIKSINYQNIQTEISDLSSLASQASASSSFNIPAVILQAMQQKLISLAGSLDLLAGEFNLQGSTPFVASLLNTYFSTDRSVARINVSLSSNPYSAETIDGVSEIRKTAGEVIGSSGLKGSTYYLGGESAVRADIMLINNSDFGTVVGFAVAGILLVIIILLRSVLAPLYMVLTVLLNYGATLGIVTILFSGVLHQDAMYYMLPIFIFIVLVALGADYNIFLVTRIKEESNRKSIKEAVSSAVAHTGGVITSCGIILAGTFATLVTSPLQMVTQIGAAIAVGVIVDTFIVRALLVPSIATLAGRWSWWPFHVRRPP